MSWAVMGISAEELFGWTHRLVHEALVILLVVLASVGFTSMLSRVWPPFLLAPRGLSPRFWVTRALVTPPVVGIVLAVVFGVVAFLHTRATEDPADPQYGVSIAWAIVLFPVFLTPLASVVAIWIASVRRRKGVLPIDRAP
jgi:membrane protein insertase Oxa1/YidC/SpoIIIJ